MNKVKLKGLEILKHWFCIKTPKLRKQDCVTLSDVLKTWNQMIYSKGNLNSSYKLDEYFAYSVNHKLIGSL